MENEQIGGSNFIEVFRANWKPFIYSWPNTWFTYLNNSCKFSSFPWAFPPIHVLVTICNLDFSQILLILPTYIYITLIPSLTFWKSQGMSCCSSFHHKTNKHYLDTIPCPPYDIIQSFSLSLSLSSSLSFSLIHKNSSIYLFQKFQSIRSSNHCIMSSAFTTALQPFSPKSLMASGSHNWLATLKPSFWISLLHFTSQEALASLILKVPPSLDYLCLSRTIPFWALWLFLPLDGGVLSSALSSSHSTQPPLMMPYYFTISFLQSIIHSTNIYGVLTMYFAVFQSLVIEWRIKISASQYGQYTNK